MSAGGDTANDRKDKQRPPFGLPELIVLVRRPEGWRHTVATADRALVCGALRGVGADAPVEEAKDAAAAMLREVGRDFHRTALEVVWDESAEPGTAGGRIRPVA